MDLPSDDQVLDRITERITSRLREEVRLEVTACQFLDDGDRVTLLNACRVVRLGTQVLRDVQEEAKRKGVEHQKIEGFLAAELEQATCPICFELMVPPARAPILIFPCGHTFCNGCLEAHIKAARRQTCPLCRSAIESRAPNVMMQQLIEGFASKKAFEKSRSAAEKPKPVVEVEARSAQPTEAHGVDQALLDGCNGDAREQVERYVREWRNISMRWRIYDNEAQDCLNDIDDLKSRQQASKLVKEHLTSELSDAQRRLEEVKQEIELIQTQLEQQSERDTQANLELLEKAKRRQLLASTKETLNVERDKIRLMMKHYLPDANVDALLR